MTFSSCQNGACSNEYFLLQVDYALEGSTFWLSKLCVFCHLFHAEMSWHAYCFSVVIVSVWHDWWFAVWCKSIFLTSFETLSSSLQLNKGFRLFNFLRSPFLIYWKWFSFDREWDGFLQMFCHAGPGSLVFLQDVKVSRMVIHRSKFQRMALLQLKLKLL